MMQRELIVGGGCFWCTEAVFQQLKGVNDVESGYANGDTLNPSYQEICTGTTNHAEVVKITYDETILPTEVLFEIFFATHNPTTLNQQGADRGTQYRSIILYHDEETKELAQQALINAQEHHDQPIVTTIEAKRCYFPAEKYHQAFFQNNPNQGYCLATIPPKLSKLHEKFAKWL
jgi:methionine-S-sulfoxide reductase